MKAKLMLMLLPVFFAACGGGSEETPVEQKEEEAGVEEVVAEEETTPSPTSFSQEEWMKLSPAEKEAGKKGPPQQTSPFEGQHENLGSGDTAVWTSGLELTISDVYVAPNEHKALMQKAEARDEENRAKGKEVKSLLLHRRARRRMSPTNSSSIAGLSKTTAQSPYALRVTSRVTFWTQTA